VRSERRFYRLFGRRATNVTPANAIRVK
jgi:hypothetical protein